MLLAGRQCWARPSAASTAAAGRLGGSVVVRGPWTLPDCTAAADCGARCQAAATTRYQRVYDNVDSAAEMGSSTPSDVQADAFQAQPQAVMADVVQADDSASTAIRGETHDRVHDPGQYDAADAQASNSSSYWEQPTDWQQAASSSGRGYGSIPSGWDTVEPAGQSSATDSSNSSNGGFNRYGDQPYGSYGDQPYVEADWGDVEPVLDWGEDPYTTADQQAAPTDAAAAAMFESTSGMASSEAGAWYETGRPSYDTSGNGMAAEAGPAGYMQPPDITVLTPPDAAAVIPLPPNSSQAQYYRPKTLPERVVQVLGSIGASVALSKTAVLAGPALLYPVWAPWIRAGIRNVELYARQYQSLGMWRAQVLRVDISCMPSAYSQAMSYMTGGDTLNITVGDPWPNGARAQLVFPFLPGAEDIMVGEPAELLVCGRSAAFQDFKVVREVYLPQTGIWLSEYPFVNRDMFLNISLAIERARQAAAADVASSMQ